MHALIAPGILLREAFSFCSVVFDPVQSNYVSTALIQNRCETEIVRQAERGIALCAVCLDLFWTQTKDHSIFILLARNKCLSSRI